MNRKIQIRLLFALGALAVLFQGIPAVSAQSGGLRTYTSETTAAVQTTEVVAGSLPVMEAESPAPPAETEPAPDTDISENDTPAEPEILSFPDVNESDWFYTDVTKLASLGIINGYPDGSFLPHNQITNAEFIKILMISAGMDLEEVPEEQLYAESWASLYISIAYANGIITDADLDAGFSPDDFITRSAMTKMMILALGIEPSRIDDPFTDISDMYASTAYNEYLLRGYLQPDDTRIYDGGSPAARSEAAAIAVRIIEYREDAYKYKKNAILENASENPLNNEFELLNLFYILNREFFTEFTFETAIPAETVSSYYTHSNLINLEYFYSSGIYATPTGNVYPLTIQYDTDIEVLKQYHAEAEEKADKVIEAIITEGMTDADKVKAIHDYLILNCEYDYNNYLIGTIPYESYIAYGALCGRMAVCQGYSAAFNMLCERVGIRSVAVGGYAPGSTEDHAWNMVLVDGQLYHIDVTHDDPVPDQKGKISYKYFYLTDTEMTNLGYTWDKEQSNLKYFY
ncbi:MAG: S-layer homology domain-containing protein [Clostridia bacterium]|nr:S-layer homology domain-containing protein [Clostridia bacterium]